MNCWISIRLMTTDTCFRIRMESITERNMKKHLLMPWCLKGISVSEQALFQIRIQGLWLRSILLHLEIMLCSEQEQVHPKINLEYFLQVPLRLVDNMPRSP